MTEARLHPRLRLSAYADVIGTEVLLAREVSDISLGGLRFSGRAWEQAGSKLEIVLSFPDAGAATVHVTGEVVRASDLDMGIKFIGMSEEQRWALKKYVKPKR